MRSVKNAPTGAALLQHHLFFINARTRLGSKEIAHAHLGENVAWMGGIDFDFVTQAVDIHLEHVAFTDVLCAPDMLQ